MLRLPYRRGGRCRAAPLDNPGQKLDSRSQLPRSGSAWRELAIIWLGLASECPSAANTSLLVNIERKGGQQNERMHRPSSPRPGEAAAKIAPRAAHEACPWQAAPNEPDFHEKGENGAKEGMKTRLPELSTGRGTASRLDQGVIDGPRCRVRCFSLVIAPAAPDLGTPSNCPSSFRWRRSSYRDRGATAPNRPESAVLDFPCRWDLAPRFRGKADSRAV